MLVSPRKDAMGIRDPRRLRIPGMSEDASLPCSGGREAGDGTTLSREALDLFPRPSLPRSVCVCVCVCVRRAERHRDRETET